MPIIENDISKIIKERIDNFELNPDERFYRPVISDTAMAIQSARDDHRPELFYQGNDIEFDTFVDDMIEYGQVIRQVQSCPERGIVVTTPVGCFNAVHAAIAAICADAGTKVISHDEYLKEHITDLQLTYNEDFEWDFKKRLKRFNSPKVKTEVDKQKIQQAIAKRARKLRQKELHNESIKKHSRI